MHPTAEVYEQVNRKCLMVRIISLRPAGGITQLTCMPCRDDHPPCDASRVRYTPSVEWLLIGQHTGAYVDRRSGGTVKVRSATDRTLSFARVCVSSGDPDVLTPHLLAVGVQNVDGPPLLVLCCYAWPVIQYQFCRQWLNSACTLISVPGSIIKHQYGFYCI